MSFFTYHSRHSWPPYKATTELSRPRNDRKSVDLGIDANPFSYFISPAFVNDHNLEEECFSAGIDTKPSPRPHSPFRRRRDNESSVTEAAKTPPAILRRWIKYMETHHPYIYHHHQDEGPPPKPVVPFIAPSSDNTERGREIERSAEIIRGRKQARSRSGRPRSWREPSADLWPVSEGCEGIEEIQTDQIGDEIRINNPPARERRIRFAEEVG